MISEVLRIANAQAFWGDSSDAPARLVAQLKRPGDIDYLTLDYLAEVTMSILARQKERDPSLGYARDFIDVCGSLIGASGATPGFRVVTNAGGLNPVACARAVAKLLAEAGCQGTTIGVVHGDDCLPAIRASLAENPNTTQFAHLETAQPISTIADRLVTANAYLGSQPIVEALRQRRASIVITGRVADPSLTVAPCVHHFGWSANNYDAIAGATVAGHLIECGTQVTGGISTDWMSIDRPHDIGMPIVEIDESGACVATKAPGAGGRVDVGIVKEQLLYEIGDPDNYVSPDAIVSFLNLKVEEHLGGWEDHVRISGAKGRSPTQFYKVTATYRAGYRASGTLTIIGRDAVAKARRAGQSVYDRLKVAGAAPERFNIECLGSGDSMPGVLPRRDDLMETVLRLTAADSRREVIEKFSREIIPLVTAGPQGTTGYFDGRPAVREVYGYWPCLIARERVTPIVEYVEV